jgi:ParB family chromosome partitioning protein
MARAGGLGRGLGSLIPSEKQPEQSGAGVDLIAVNEVKPNPHQPRQHFDEEALSTLTDSIRELGVLQPILVRQASKGYEIIAGERRWRAAKRVGLTTIPALIRQADDTSSLEQAIVENVQRSDLNPLEEATAYQQLIEEFKFTHDQVAKRVGKSRTSITNALRLLVLPPSIQKMIREDKLSMGHARALLSSPDRVFQEKIAKQAVAEGWSVRAVEDAMRDANGEEIDLTKKERKAPLRAPGLIELESLLGDFLNTRVNISMAGDRGKIQIDFSTLEDLERIYLLMAENEVDITA